MITVQFPDSVSPNFFPYWNKDNQTGQLTGYYVDYLAAVLKEAGIKNYTFRSQNINGATYNSLGRFCFISCTNTSSVFHPSLNLPLPYLLSHVPNPSFTFTPKSLTHKKLVFFETYFNFSE